MARTKNSYKTSTSVSSTTASPPSSTSEGYLTTDFSALAKAVKAATKAASKATIKSTPKSANARPRNWPTCDSDRVMRTRAPRNKGESSSSDVAAASVIRPAKITKPRVTKPKAPASNVAVRPKITLKLSAPKLNLVSGEDMVAARILMMLYEEDRKLGGGKGCGGSDSDTVVDGDTL